MTHAPHGRSLAGVLLSVAAAATFGVFAPAAKGALAHVTAVRAAGLAYLAAAAVALVAWLVRRLARARSAGRAVRVADLGRLIGMTLCGGALGPALFFAGVRLVEAHDAALVQHLEFVLTVFAAMIVLGERPGRRGYAGLLLVGAGLVLLSLGQLGAADGAAPSSWTGVGLLALACLAWAVDNTLARGVSDIDPFVVVSLKGLGAGLLLVLLTPGEPWPRDASGWGLVFLAGGVGVGLSLVLELLALRRIGAALNAGLFACGPAFGFAFSLLFLGERASPIGFAALFFCLMGAVALSVDRHAHHHVHDALRHRHRHDHLDGHHTHDHGPDFDPATVHEHEHDHEPVAHAHEHVHDRHHRHRH
ncbi:MAG: DMT family transporter [bacterium]|nr:DMT family transporter [bacterium]